MVRRPGELEKVSFSGCFYITGNFAPKACADRKPAAGAFLLSYRTIIGKNCPKECPKSENVKKTTEKRGKRRKFQGKISA